MENEIRKPKKRMKKWVLFMVVSVTFFVVYKLITDINRTPIPITRSLVDSIGRKYYKHIVPVSGKDKTYLMAVSYIEGFSEPHDVFKIYYIWYKNASDEPLRAVMYDKLEDIEQVRFYREGLKANSPITVVLATKQGDSAAKTWLFTPPKVFPVELIESDFAKSGFREYREWRPPFE